MRETEKLKSNEPIRLSEFQDGDSDIKLDKGTVQKIYVRENQMLIKIDRFIGRPLFGKLENKIKREKEVLFEMIQNKKISEEKLVENKEALNPYFFRQKPLNGKK